jgi:hypothetical protein
LLLLDAEGLLSLYQQCFRFPFFRDSKLALYSALGDRKVVLGIVPNPFKIVKRYMEIRKRLVKDKGIEGNIIGEGEGMILHFHCRVLHTAAPYIKKTAW